MVTLISAVGGLVFVCGLPVWVGSMVWLGDKLDRKASAWIVED